LNNTTAKTQRFKLTIEYDGQPFSGWQRQDNAPSVQQTLEKAIARLPGSGTVLVQGSGRTDAGVHALAQVAHVDLNLGFAPDKLQAAINHFLFDVPISILRIEMVSDEFHARFSATKRHYIYRILNRRAPATFAKGLIWHVKTPLDAEAMNDAAQVLVGNHDFTTFRNVHCQAESPVKTLDYLSVERNGEEVSICAGAQSFLHHQIRSIAGTLKFVGAGKWTKADVVASLEARDRAALAYNAPPDGLYFKHVDFD